MTSSTSEYLWGKVTPAGGGKRFQLPTPVTPQRQVLSSLLAAPAQEPQSSGFGEWYNHGTGEERVKEQLSWGALCEECSNSYW